MIEKASVKAEIDKLRVAVQSGAQECDAVVVMIYLIIDGLRLGEVCQLKIADYDIKQKMIRVAPIKVRERKIALSSKTCVVLETYLKGLARHNEYMFPDSAGTNPIAPSLAARKIRKRLNGVGAHEIRYYCYLTGANVERRN